MRPCILLVAVALLLIIGSTSRVWAQTQDGAEGGTTPCSCAGWTWSGRDLPEREYAALLAFKAAMNDNTGLLSSWQEGVHPCTWEGVICHCGDVYPSQADCPAAPVIGDEIADDPYEHVFGLDFGPRKASTQKLSGLLPAELSNLTEARVLYLDVNDIRWVLASVRCRSRCLDPLTPRRQGSARVVQPGRQACLSGRPAVTKAAISYTRKPMFKPCTYIGRLH